MAKPKRPFDDSVHASEKYHQHAIAKMVRLTRQVEKGEATPYQLARAALQYADDPALQAQHRDSIRKSVTQILERIEQQEQ